MQIPVVSNETYQEYMAQGMPDLEAELKSFEVENSFISSMMDGTDIVLPILLRDNPELIQPVKNVITLHVVAMYRMIEKELNKLPEGN